VRVVLGLATIEPNHFGLANHSALAVPRAGGVAEVDVDVLGRSGSFVEHAGGNHGDLGVALEPVVPRHPDHVVDPDDFEELEQLGLGESAVQALHSCESSWP
jgi:hypothetical protein